jgi:ArsR family transcriptional regulator
LIKSQKNLLEARANVFKALGHPSRLAVIDALAGGERCVADLHEEVGADISTVSRHLCVESVIHGTGRPIELEGGE